MRLRLRIYAGLTSRQLTYLAGYLHAAYLDILEEPNFDRVPLSVSGLCRELMRMDGAENSRGDICDGQLGIDHAQGALCS